MIESKALDPTKVKRITSEKEYGQLLRIQIDSLKGLTDTYTAAELEIWVSYIKSETARRYAAFENLGYTDKNDDLVAFVSWTIQDKSANIECLYTLAVYRGQKIGEFLLQAAEEKLKDTLVHIRSTLSARTFYEKNGYTFIAYDVSRAGFKIALLEKQL